MHTYIVTLQFRSGKRADVYWTANNGGAARNECASAYDAAYAICSVEIE